MTGTEPKHNDQEVSDIAVALLNRFEGRPEYPYSGVAVDRERLGVMVYRVPGDAEFDRLVRGYGTARVTVTLVDAPKTRREYEVIRDEVMAATDLPIRVWAAGPTGDAQGVDVVGEGDIEAAQRMLDSRYGVGIVRIEEGYAGLIEL